MKVIVLAGGHGTRLWAKPTSRSRVSSMNSRFFMSFIADAGSAPGILGGTVWRSAGMQPALDYAANL